MSDHLTELLLLGGVLVMATGRLKTREWKTRERQKMQRVENE